MITLKLTVTNGPSKGRWLIVPCGETRLVGRGTQADFVVIDLRLSREHFLIVGTQDSWLVRDVSSRHGTLLNNHHFEEKLLEAGDVITAGDTKFFVAFTNASIKLTGPPQSQHPVVATGRALERPGLAPACRLSQALFRPFLRELIHDQRIFRFSC